MHYQLALLGFGNVGRALAELLIRKESELKNEHNITFTVVGIATGSKGRAINPKGIDLKAALQAYANEESLEGLGTVASGNSLEFVQACGADVLFENSPVNYESGQPAIDHIRAALNLNMHVATANKGPVVHAWKELKDLAKSKKRQFFHESAVMDGAPIFSLFRSALPAAQLTGFKAILNSTTNLILSRMENGESFDDAVKYAQAVGIAETDPSGDVDGWDAAIKVGALATVLMNAPLKPSEINPIGIRGITPEMIAAGQAQNKRYKLICTAEKKNGQVIGTVAPELIANDSPFYSIDGSTSIIQFKTDVLGDLTLINADPGAHTTAYGLLADFIHAVEG